MPWGKQIDSHYESTLDLVFTVNIVNRSRQNIKRVFLSEVFFERVLAKKFKSFYIKKSKPITLSNCSYKLVAKDKLKSAIM